MSGYHGSRDLTYQIKSGVPRGVSIRVPSARRAAEAVKTMYVGSDGVVYTGREAVIDADAEHAREMRALHD